MKVKCPDCAKQVPAANLNLATGWGKCDGCQELFALADVVPGFTAGGGDPKAVVVERPYNARAVVERNSGELLDSCSRRRLSRFDARHARVRSLLDRIHRLLDAGGVGLFRQRRHQKRTGESGVRVVFDSVLARRIRHADRRRLESLGQTIRGASTTTA
ncbi:MAG: hypothetical protein QM775_23990 [Pirellulales bacterium]